MATESDPARAPDAPSPGRPPGRVRLIASWAFVAAPLAWGVFQTLKKAWALLQ